MLIKIILFILIFTQLNASNMFLKKTYYIDGNDINISSIVKNTTIDKTLFEIPLNKSSKRIKASFFIKILQENGYNNFHKQSNYITFKKKSNIDLCKIKDAINKYYQSNYKLIKIKNIEIHPRSFIDKLPKEYSVHLRKRNYLSCKGVVSIKTPQNKQTFFDYLIKANIVVYKTKYRLKKNTQISAFNMKKKIILLDKLRAKPIQHITKNTLQAKYQLPQDKILTIQNTQKLNIIKRGATVSVVLHDNGIDISFVAKALQNARMGDTLKVENSKNKKLKVKAIGINKAEMP